MFERYDENVYRATTHKQITSRTALIRDRAMNLFKACESLEKVVPNDDYRFEKFRHLLHDYFTGIVMLFGLEDEIDDVIEELVGEVGR